MSRFCSIRLFTIVTLLSAAFMAKAQDPVDSDKVLLTITNKSDSELLLRLSLAPIPPTFSPPQRDANSAPNPAAPPARNNVVEFNIGQIVQPKKRATLQIPKGRYMVEASAPFSPAPSPSAVRRTVRLSPSRELNDDIGTNEVWTFELENGPGGSLDPNDRVDQWKRTVQPSRPPKPSGAGPQEPRTIPSPQTRLAPIIPTP